jgi:murein DD-endopeptidase MepM/ murein hydrolase activator NlpD
MFGGKPRPIRLPDCPWGHEAASSMKNPGAAMLVCMFLAGIVGLFWLQGRPLQAVQLDEATPAVAPLGAADPADMMGFTVPDITKTDITLDDATSSADEGLFYTAYRVLKGDTISHIAETFGVTADAIITFNDITNARTLQIGKLLKIPNLNGILYQVKRNDTLDGIARAHGVSLERMLELNAVDAGGLEPGQRLFLPDARLSNITLREINGDLFSWPIRGWITSWYGWRNDPFTGSRSFHTGIDIGSAEGLPVRAAMEGTVSATGFSTISGNYVVLSHHSGYSTMYAHLSSIAVRQGQRVSTSTILGAVGSTGYSTGPHLHFTVQKHGRLVNPMTLLR